MCSTYEEPQLKKHRIEIVKEKINITYHNGKKFSEEIQLTNKNLFDSKYIEFYPSGQIKITGFYKNNKYHGDWKFYFEDGKLLCIDTYVNGKYILNGTWSYEDHNKLKSLYNE